VTKHSPRRPVIKDIEKNVRIAAPIERVWAALTDPASIEGWMGEDSAVEVDLKVGGRYRLFGGETTGKFTRIERPHRLEYTWRQATWRKGWPDSIVRWGLQTDRDGTRVSLVHTQFPNSEERDSHDEGWDAYWLEPMQAWLESAD